VKRSIRVGAGAGFQGDRLDPALVLAERAKLDVLALECLGERTVALAQLRRRKDRSQGYDPLLDAPAAVDPKLLEELGLRVVARPDVPKRP